MLACGKLSIHEEFPDATFEAITPFLSEGVEQALSAERQDIFGYLNQLGRFPPGNQMIR